MARRLTYELVRIFGGELAAADIEQSGGPHSHDGVDHSHERGDDHSHGLVPEHEHPGAPQGLRGDDVVLVGADIARGRYGDSEEQLRKLFQYAREGQFHANRPDDDPIRRTVLLFDDVESLLLARSSGGAKEWHFSQNSVFFHAIDELDTSRTAVVLTTNRIDLVDEAIVDRFLTYEFGSPPTDVLEQVACHRAKLQRMDDAQLAPILKAISDPDSSVRTIRDVERMVARAYIASILGKPRDVSAR
jgi:hypothetical protein